MSSLFRRFVDAVNTVPVMALNVPGLRSLAGRYFTVVTYTGRRSGQIFSTPVNYWRSGDDIVIWVGIPRSRRGGETSSVRAGRYSFDSTVSTCPGTESREKTTTAA